MALTGNHRSSSHAASTVPLPGRVVVLEPDATLAISSPGGRLEQSYRQFGTFQQAIPNASSDGRYLVLPSGRVLDLGPAGLRPSGQSVAPLMAPYSYVQPLGSFADSDRYVVVRQDNGYSGRQPTSGWNWTLSGREPPWTWGRPMGPRVIRPLRELS